MNEVDGLNAGFARTLLEEYLENPEAVPAEWREHFERGDSALVATHPGIRRLVESLRTDVPAKEGSLVTVRLQLPGEGRGFTVLGRVVRSVSAAPGSLKESGMGIAFIDIAAADRDRIQAYVAERGSLREAA